MGKHHGKPTPPPSMASISASPNPAVQYDYVTVTGTGFPPNDNQLNFSLDGSVGGIISDANGNISRTFQMTVLGSHTVVVLGSGVSATCAFEVVAA